MKKYICSLIGLFVFIIVACNSAPEKLEPEKFLVWVNSNKAFSKVKEVNGLAIRTRYLPADYLAYKEYIASDSANYDSLRKSYACGLTFQVVLHADKAGKAYANLLQYGVSTQEELSQRIRLLSFASEHFIYSDYNEVKFLPVLAHYEGYDPLSNSISFQVVFVIPDYNCGNPQSFKDVVITFDDPIWNTGKNNFEFSGADIQSVPDLKF